MPERYSDGASTPEVDATPQRDSAPQGDANLSDSLPAVEGRARGNSAVSAGSSTGSEAMPQGSAMLLRAAWYGALRMLPGTLVALFALVPGVSSRIFSTYSCVAFGYDDTTGETRSFLYADYAQECSGDKYAGLRAQALVFFLIWPIGVPCFFFALLLASRTRNHWAPALSRSIRFLHAEYRGQLFYWE